MTSKTSPYLLHRVMKWTSSGIEFCIDQRHESELSDGRSIDGSLKVSTPTREIEHLNDEEEPGDEEDPTGHANDDERYDECGERTRQRLHRAAQQPGSTGPT